MICFAKKNQSFFTFRTAKRDIPAKAPPISECNYMIQRICPEHMEPRNYSCKHTVDCSEIQLTSSKVVYPTIKKSFLHPTCQVVQEFFSKVALGLNKHCGSQFPLCQHNSVFTGWFFSPSNKDPMQSPPPQKKRKHPRKWLHHELGKPINWSNKTPHKLVKEINLKLPNEKCYSPPTWMKSCFLVDTKPPCSHPWKCMDESLAVLAFTMWMFLAKVMNGGVGPLRSLPMKLHVALQAKFNESLRIYQERWVILLDAVNSTTSPAKCKDK